MTQHGAAGRSSREDRSRERHPMTTSGTTFVFRLLALPFRALRRLWPFRGRYGVLAAIAVIAGSVLYLELRHPTLELNFRTSAVERGDLDVTISATGTLEPEETVDVGAQVAGKILTLGTDTTGKEIDYGSKIAEGAVLARIDDALYRADVDQGEAQLKRAKAGVLSARARFAQAERDWKRAERLGPSDALSQSAYDTYRAAYETTQAALADADAQVSQAEAALVRARRNLEYCTITSPVTGVIIDRRVSVGQTVVSSLNAPSLFLIAKDLGRLELWASVNEADIGSIAPDQKVSFTVDAFPGEAFTGAVRKIRLNATMTQNVVTYIVEVFTDNTSGRLLPYLTANARFAVRSAHDALLVPNASLRWVPPGRESDRERRSERPERGERADRGVSSSQGETPSRGTTQSRAAAPPADRPDAREAAVWVLRDGKPHRVPLFIGQSDGVMTEVLSGDIESGTDVITGSSSATQGSGSAQSTRNPFAPTIPRRGGAR